MVDILHPLSSLEWRQCRGPPVNVGTAHAVWLKDKVYVGGGMILGRRREEARLYIYSPATDTWTTLDTPVYYFGLTTYHSQLVLVGGREYVGENIHGDDTNKLWTLSEDGQWQETLPPMPTPCGMHASAVSHGDHLLVISGDYPNNNVYVYNGHHWASAQHPSHRLYSIKSTVLNGHLYLMGRGQPSLSHTNLYSCFLDSLLASCQPSETSQPSFVWKRLTDIPSGQCYPAVFGNRLVAVGEGSSYTTTSLHAYSSLTQSWVHVGDVSLTGIYLCAVVLPSNELMVVRGQTAVKLTLKLSPFNPESSFSMRAVSLLEQAAGIPVMTTLTDYTRRIQIFLGLAHYTFLDLNGLLNYWISSIQWLPPSWRNLLLIIRLLKLDELAQRMETYLSAGATEEPHDYPVEGETEQEEGEEVESRLQLREQAIYRLKQEMASLREEKESAIFMLEERIKEVEYENEELRNQMQIKRGDVKEKPISLLPVKTEVKEEPHVEEPVSLPSVKREVKEEAIPMIKAEMSAQSTSATWNLRGVEVCGEMTVVVYSSHDQQITWPGYGLRLNIPKGCLPAGMEQCTVNIKASLAGQYEFPENSHPVSAIIWLRCEDVHKFTRPVTVEIQHCAKSDNVTNLKLSFVRAVCSQKQLPYTFKQLVGDNFTSHSSYGVIELNSFSGVGVTQEGSEDREYCSQLFYVGRSDWYKIHYIVTWNIDAYLTVVKEEYAREGAIRDVHQPVEFESEAISLNIPLEGVSIKGWKITPLMRPVVTKKQVDNFREGKLTPCCQLLAKVTGRKKKIPTLQHQVKLKGAKYPNDVFVINLPAGVPEQFQTFGDLAAIATATAEGPPPTKKGRLHSDESALLTTLSQALSTTNSAFVAGPSSTALTHAPVAGAATGLDAKLDLSTDHFKVTNYLRKLDDRQIRYVGGALGLAYDILDKMKNLPEEMVAAWLRREDFVMSMSGEPTWRTLIQALRKVGQEGTARDIEKAEFETK